ncbi:hypothetical protein [Streptosporangium roseum]
MSAQQGYHPSGHERLSVIYLASEGHRVADAIDTARYRLSTPIFEQ